MSSVCSSWRLLVVPTVFMHCSQIGFTTCLLETTAADAIMFASLNPRWAALMGCFFLKDKVAVHTMAAMVVAAGAVACAFLPTVLSGAQEEAELPKGASGPTLHVNLIALATGATLAAFITGSRAGSMADPTAPMSVARALGSMGAALVTLPGAILWTGSLADPTFLIFISCDAVLEASYDISMPFAAREITSAGGAAVHMDLLWRDAAPLHRHWVGRAGRQSAGARRPRGAAGGCGRRGGPRHPGGPSHNGTAGGRGPGFRPADQQLPRHGRRRRPPGNSVRRHQQHPSTRLYTRRHSAPRPSDRALAARATRVKEGTAQAAVLQVQCSQIFASFLAKSISCIAGSFPCCSSVCHPACPILVELIDRERLAKN